jgi:DNA-binding transcriptional regulator YdaS (Cro superfamily)
VDGRVVSSDVVRTQAPPRNAKSLEKISSGSVARRDLIPALKGEPSRLSNGNGVCSL